MGVLLVKEAGLLPLLTAAMPCAMSQRPPLAIYRDMPYVRRAYMPAPRPLVPDALRPALQLQQCQRC